MSNYFDRFDEPKQGGSTNYFDQFDEPVDTTAVTESDNTYFGNIARGAGERFFDLVGGVTRFAGETGDTVGDFMAKNLGDLVYHEDGSIEWAVPPQKMLNQESPLLRFARDFENVDLGYNEEQATAWEEVKSAPLSNVLPFALEQGLISTADMVFAVRALPGYIAARIGEIGQKRAQNDGRQNATMEDFLAVSPAAVGAAFLERLGAKGILGIDQALVQSGKELGTEAAKAGAKEASTEFLQEGMEGTAETLGTETGFSALDVLDRAFAGAVGGGVFGGSARGVTGGIELATSTKVFGESKTDAVDAAIDALSPSDQPGIRESAEPASLTEGDIASPIPNGVIAKGKAAIANVEAKQQADANLSESDLPTIGTDVVVDFGEDGGSKDGVVVDSFSQLDPLDPSKTEPGIVVEFADGRRLRQSASVLASTGVTITPKPTKSTLEPTESDTEPPPDSGPFDQNIPESRIADESQEPILEDSVPNVHSVNFGSNTQQKTILNRAKRKLEKQFPGRVVVAGRTLKVRDGSRDENAAAAEEIARQIQFSIARSEAARKRGGPKRKGDKGLLGWVSRNGGIIDSGGELAAKDFDKWHFDKPGMGKLVKAPVDVNQGYFTSPSTINPNIENGWERMFEKAVDADFFPELIGQDIRQLDAREMMLAKMDAENRADGIVHDDVDIEDENQSQYESQFESQEDRERFESLVADYEEILSLDKPIRHKYDRIVRIKAEHLEPEEIYNAGKPITYEEFERLNDEIDEADVRRSGEMVEGSDVAETRQRGGEGSSGNVSRSAISQESGQDLGPTIQDQSSGELVEGYDVAETVSTEGKIARQSDEEESRDARDSQEVGIETGTPPQTAAQSSIEGAQDVSGSNVSLESDRAGATSGDQIRTDGVPASPREDVREAGSDSEQATTRDAERSTGLFANDAASEGERGDIEVRTRQSAPGGRAAERNERGGSGNDGNAGTQAESARAGSATNPADQVSKRPELDEALPQLHAEQRNDVLFAEERFEKGSGVLFTNGTGTGKTFTGMGIIKRFVDAGKKNILVLTPSQPINNAWVNTDRKSFNTGMSILSDTKTASEGVVITTYANLANNPYLAGREWDLVVADESHSLLQNASGEATTNLDNFRAISNHRRGHLEKGKMLEPELWIEVRKLEGEVESMRKQVIDAANGRIPVSEESINEWIEQRTGLEQIFVERRGELREKGQANVKKFDLENKPLPKVTFLSATPFAYDKTVDYAEGYLFDYPVVEDSQGYNAADGQQ